MRQAADYSAIYDPDADLDRIYTDATGAAIGEHVAPGDRLLELGCATGRMTEAFVAAGAVVTAVDRSQAYLDRLAARGLRGVLAVRGDLDAGLPDVVADHVVLANVLHEVGHPLAVLRAARARLRPGGTVHVTLQNPRSLHRLVALEMGLLDTLDEVSERGSRYGTQRLWAPEALEALVAGAGFRVTCRTGLVLKPLPNALLEALPDDVLDGLARAGRHLPEHAAMTYVTGVPA